MVVLLLIKEELQQMSQVRSQAIEQLHAGADILDVNVGLPGIDEKAMMVRVVKALQGVVDLPLQLDSTDPRSRDVWGRRRVVGAAPDIVAVEAKDYATVFSVK